MQELTFREMIDFLEQTCGARFSVCDLGGLPAGLLQLPPDRLVHATSFCAVAKSTTRGLNRCLCCKNRANRLARRGEPFEGLCTFGLYEFACPVRQNGRVAGVVYAGNLRADSKRAAQVRHRACSKTGVQEQRLAAVLQQCAPLEPNAAAARTAVRMLAEVLEKRLTEYPTDARHYHTAVKALLQATEHHFAQPLSLEAAARAQHMDAKYLGRLFLRQVGVPFHAHLNDIRLQHAASLLRRTSLTVLNVALECGFQNVSYFNRQFRQRFACTPTAYRKRMNVQA